MKTLLRIFVIPAVLCASTPYTLLSADKPTALFLAGAEPSVQLFSMGGVFTSASFEDAFYNPWMLGLAASPGVTFAYWPGAVAKSKYNFASAILPPTRFGVFSVHYMGYDAGDELIEELDGTSRTVKLEDDKIYGIGYGIPITERLFAGMHAKQMTSTLAQEYTAKASLYDAGIVFHSLHSEHTAGVSLKNYGSDITYFETAEPLPAQIKAGYTYTVRKFTLGASYDVFLYDTVNGMSFGMEYKPGLRSVILRGGIRTLGDTVKYAAGMGINLKQVNLNIGYQFRSDKDISNDTPLLLSLSWFFGGRDAKTISKVYAARGMKKRARAVKNSDVYDDDSEEKGYHQQGSTWYDWYNKIK